MGELRRVEGSSSGCVRAWTRGVPSHSRSEGLSTYVQCRAAAAPLWWPGLCLGEEGAITSGGPEDLGAGSALCPGHDWPHAF